MKVLIVNTYDTGGAANACIRLHLGLLKSDVDSRILFAHTNNNFIPNSTKFEIQIPVFTFQERIKNKIDKIAHKLKIINLEKQEKPTPEDLFLEKRGKNLETFSFHSSNYDITESPLYQEADIIHLHWIANFIDYPSFFAKNTKPVVWTLHDESPFEAGEHYTEEYADLGNDGKPTKRVYSPLELTWQAKILAQKKEIFKVIQNIVIVSPSTWLCNLSKKSVVFAKFNHEVIPYGLDIKVFNYKDKNFCRQVFNLPTDKTIMLFVADSIEKRRKGYIYLQKVVENLQDSNILLCTIGSNSNLPNLYNNIIEFGKIQDDRLMSILYASADIFVIPSLEDNLPNTVLESLCCGTPVIGFPIGGIPDMVQDNQNGYLCPEISVQSLKETIEKFLENPTFFDRKRIAQEAKEKYALEVQAKAYLQLYQDILNKKSPS